MLIFLLILQIFALFETFEAAEFDVMTKSVKCYEIDKQFFSNYSCKIKVSREFPGGLLYVGFNFQKIKRLHLNAELFYKYGTIYHPYLIKVDLDICELRQKNSTFLSDKLLKKCFSILEKEVPLVLKGCPFEGLLETNMMNLNESVSQVLPPVVPTGFFKVHIRSYIPDTMTLGYIDIEVQVKARKAFRAIDFSMMQMG